VVVQVWLRSNIKLLTAGKGQKDTDKVDVYERDRDESTYQKKYTLLFAPNRPEYLTIQLIRLLSKSELRMTASTLCYKCDKKRENYIRELTSFFV